MWSEIDVTMFPDVVFSDTFVGKVLCSVIQVGDVMSFVSKIKYIYLGSVLCYDLFSYFACHSDKFHVDTGLWMW